jgi:chromosome segregation ATPase
MAEASIVQDGIDRFRDAFGSLEDEVERVQRQLRARRRKLEKQLNANRKDLEKRLDSGRKDLEKRAKKLQKEVRKNPAVKRLEELRKDAEKRYADGVESVLKALQIASKSDVQRIDRKISQLNKKLKEMEKARARKSTPTNGQAVSA